MEEGKPKEDLFEDEEIKFFNPDYTRRKNPLRKDFDALLVGLANEATILEWSHGEVKFPETINYRKLTPEKGGLFCARIFGTTKNYECYCGKYNRPKYEGIVCEKCGVLVSHSSIRRKRMGHIKMVIPILHPLFREVAACILDMTKTKLVQIASYGKFVAIEESWDEMFKPGDTIDSADYYHNYSEYDQIFRSGGEAILFMLKQLDIERELVKLECVLRVAKKNNSVYKKKLQRRNVLLNMLVNKIKPEDLVINVLPVIPPSNRPIVSIDGQKHASSDINDLYRFVIIRNKRLEKFMCCDAPDIVVYNEKSMVTKAVCDIYESSTKRLSTGITTVKRSIVELLKGKSGLFRKSVLGKRVDFSARAVICVKPDLSLYECGIPIQIALELFRPMLYGELRRKGIASSLRQAKEMVNSESVDSIRILHELTKDYPIILNRAPTLHRLGMQAFKIKLIGGKAIGLHPLVCSAFNADFDGDQMVAHLLITEAAKKEAKETMFVENNLLLPSNGTFVMLPTKDIVLGLYYLTMSNRVKRDLVPEDLHAVERYVELGILRRNDLINFFIEDINGKHLVETTAGRLEVWSKLPEVSRLQLDFGLFNTSLGKEEISKLVSQVHKTCRDKAQVVFMLDKLKDLGFRMLTISGITFADRDMIEPKDRQQTLDDVERKNTLYYQSFENGFITSEELDSKIISNWNTCVTQISNSVVKATIEARENFDDNGVSENNIAMMLLSGARGSKSQIQQLSGIRGLMAKPTGEISKHPILGNLKKGLEIFDYFSSTHGERKGLSDVSIKTAQAGYFTRRLVDCCQACYTNQFDCKTTKGITICAEDEEKFRINFSNYGKGRFLAEDVLLANGTVLFEKGILLDEQKIEELYSNNIKSIVCRTPVFCRAPFGGVCVLCYGVDISQNEVVKEGVAVGIIAAQSIGEPGTQLTMRTFHAGGVAKSTSESSDIISPCDGIVHLEEGQIKFVANSHGENVVLESGFIIVEGEGGERTKISCPVSAVLKVVNGEKVKNKQTLCETNPFATVILSRNHGTVKYVDLIAQTTYKSEVHPLTGIKRITVINWSKFTKKNYSPAILVEDETTGINQFYQLPINTAISVRAGESVKPGDILGKIPKINYKTQDITGGLPRVVDIYEAVKPSEVSVLAPHGGVVKFERTKDGRFVKIECPETKQSTAIELDNEAIQIVQDETKVVRGEKLTLGEAYINDVLAILGEETVCKTIISSVSAIYYEQGVTINHKHLEMPIKNMINNVVVTEVGESPFFMEEMVKYDEAEKVNEKLRAEGKKEAKFKRQMYGITQAALGYHSPMSYISFQNTKKGLIKAGIAGTVDFLTGLKENLICCRPLPLLDNVEKLKGKIDDLLEFASEF